MNGTVERRPHQNLVVIDDGSVRILRIEREDKLGALSSGLVAALGEQIAEIGRAPKIRVVILTGTGRSFIAGADVAEYASAGSMEFAEYQWRSRQVFDALASLPQITIAAVNGYAFGGGFEVALCCDFIVAAEKAKFALPEVSLGLIPGGGGTQRLSRAAGVRFAKDVVVTGRVVTADELSARGIVSAVHPGDTMLAQALEMARRIAANAPLAVRAGKRVVDLGMGQQLADALTEEQRTLIGLFASEDGREGVSAFIEKRDPTFLGR